MKTKKSLYKEYTDRDEALDAVRQMRAQGIEEIQTCDLKPDSRAPSDVGLAPKQKRRNYSVAGALIGALIGFIAANVIFLIPAFVMRFVHASLIGGVGVAICTVACAAIGLAMSFVYSKRTTREPISGTSQSVLEVSVEAEDDEQVREATRIMKLKPTFT